MLGYLRVMAGFDEGRIFNLFENQTVVIGRSENSATQLRDIRVSRLHCELRITPGQFLLVDSDSASGTFLNTERITEAELRSGDSIRVGSTVLEFHTGDLADAQNVVAAQKQERSLVAGATGLTGQILTHFKVGPVVAKGRTSTIYKALDQRDGKLVALKIMHPGFADDEEDLQRFIRSMTTALGLRHPNLVALQGAGKARSYCWISMEYIDGESLNRVIERFDNGGKLDWRYAMTVAVHVARALEAAHAQNIIHRNVMPENILVLRGNKIVAKLGDLMLAKALEGVNANPITRPGRLIGELTYMSPERISGSPMVDTRSDIYGLGATLYVLLTGQPPFAGKDLSDTLTMIRRRDPIPPKEFQADIPDSLQNAIMKMLAKHPEQRFQSPTELVRELGRISKSESVMA